MGSGLARGGLEKLHQPRELVPVTAFCHSRVYCPLLATAFTAADLLTEPS
jgi:hypothetical protein